MRSTEDLCRELESIPYMKWRQAEIVRDVIVENNLRAALEIGFYHGKSSVLIASMFEELGVGHLTTYDLEAARTKDPNIVQLLERYGLSHRVTPVFCQRSYIWELAKIIKVSKEPIFDFCYLDGAHTWDPTALGFFLIDILLKPGGVIIFDDMNWTINRSPHYQKCIKEGQNPYPHFSDDEKDTPAVRMVFEKLVPTRNYVCSEIKEVNWGLAQKIK